MAKLDEAVARRKPITKTPLVPEEQEQITLFEWVEQAKAAHPELAFLYAIPNGGKRSKPEAVRFQRAGVRKGIPDMFLSVPRGGCHGLYIELKRLDGGRLAQEQIEWLNRLSRQGYKCAVCHGWDAARREIMEYIAEGEP